MRSLWARIERVLSQVAPKSLATLRPGATLEELAVLEHNLQVALPGDLRESLQIHDGQGDPLNTMFFDGESLLSGRDIVETWTLRNGIASSLQLPPDPQGRSWWESKFIPVTICESDGYCVDATNGAVYYHSHDGVMEGPIWTSFRELMEALTRALESGRYEIKYGAVWVDIEPGGTDDGTRP